MGSLKTVALAAAVMAALAPQMTRAADMPPPIRMPEPVEEYGGWYLRGDIGMTNQSVRRLENSLFPTTAGLVILDKNFESGMLFGLGVGYKYNNWLRFDVTGEYRGETGFHGLDVYGGPPATNTNIYTAKKSEWLILANAYLDLGTWKAITPFVGAGVGASRNTIHSFRDVDPVVDSVAFANAASKWNFAWALHAGMAYDVTPNFTLELAYRYVHLGDAQSGDIIAYNGANPNYNPMIFKGLASHDVKLGARWMFADSFNDYRPPLVRKY